MESELSQEQRKREAADERYVRLHREVLELRENNEALKHRLEMQADEIGLQNAEKLMQLEKQRDENMHKIDGK